MAAPAIELTLMTARVRVRSPLADAFACKIFGEARFGDDEKNAFKL